MFWQERVRKKNKPNEHFGILKDMSLKFGQFSMRDQDIDNLMDNEPLRVMPKSLLTSKSSHKNIQGAH